MVMDRLTFLEQRVQMQDDEIQLLKINMTDVLKRLNISEEQKRTPAKGLLLQTLKTLRALRQRRAPAGNHWRSNQRKQVQQKQAPDESLTAKISLTPRSGRTGSADPEPLVSVSLRSAGSAVKPCKAFVQKSSCQNHKSPIKSPSQYFQICY